MEAKEIRKFLGSLNDLDFRYLRIQISMANDGFFHPGILDIKMGHGGLVLKPKEVERESMMGKMVLKGKLSSLKYQVGEDYLECRMIKDDYIIPISRNIMANYR